MGFSTTQKAKTTIISSLGEASSSLEVAGKVTAIGCTNSAICATPVLNVTSIPLKIASGGDSVNLDPATASVKYLSNTVEYDNIYECALTGGTYQNVTIAFDNAILDAACPTFTAGLNPVDGDSPAATKAILYWSVTASPQNSILDQGEHAVLAIAYTDAGNDDRPAALDKVRAEILLPTGAPLTIERQVPNITNLVVDMG